LFHAIFTFFAKKVTPKTPIVYSFSHLLLVWFFRAVEYDFIKIPERRYHI